LKRKIEKKEEVYLNGDYLSTQEKKSKLEWRWWRGIQYEFAANDQEI